MGTRRAWPFASLLTSPPPPAAVEISPQGVTAVAVRPAAGRPRVTAWATSPLPAGALTPTLAGTNVHDPEAVAAAVSDVLGRVGRPRRVALVLPDGAAKVSLVRFEKVPARAGELEQMLRWQVRKAVPFPIESAQVAWSAGSAVDGGGTEFVVVVMARPVLEQYEAPVERAGARPGLVDLSTFSLINLVLASGAVAAGAAGQTDWLIANLAPEAGTVAIMRGDHPIFYRARVADADERIADVVHQTAMYYEDRLGGRSFDRALVGGRGPALAEAAAALAAVLGARVDRGVALVDPGLVVDVESPGAAADEWVALAAPVGVLAREW